MMWILIRLEKVLRENTKPSATKNLGYYELK
jgi:hypothetical protein